MSHAVPAGWGNISQSDDTDGGGGGGGKLDSGHSHAGQGLLDNMYAEFSGRGRGRGGGRGMRGSGGFMSRGGGGGGRGGGMMSGSGFESAASSSSYSGYRGGGGRGGGGEGGYRGRGRGRGGSDMGISARDCDQVLDQNPHLERERICSFFTRFGACRNGDRCHRLHMTPLESPCVLLPMAYPNPKSSPVDESTGQIIEFDPRWLSKHAANYLERVWMTMMQFGRIRDCIIVDNVCHHLLGNAYVLFEDETDAARAVAAIQGKCFSEVLCLAELSPVVDFNAASCSEYDSGYCARGEGCNFLHIIRTPRTVYQDLTAAQDEFWNCVVADFHDICAEEELRQIEKLKLLPAPGTEYKNSSREDRERRYEERARIKEERRMDRMGRGTRDDRAVERRDDDDLDADRHRQQQHRREHDDRDEFRREDRDRRDDRGHRSSRDDRGHRDRDRDRDHYHRDDRGDRGDHRRRDDRGGDRRDDRRGRDDRDSGHRRHRSPIRGGVVGDPSVICHICCGNHFSRDCPLKNLNQ